MCVNRQPSNGLKSKRQPSKKVLFYRQLSKLHNVCFKVSHISLLTGSSPTSGSWWKTQLVPRILQALQDVKTRLYPKFFRNVKNDRPRKPSSKTQTVILIYTEVNIYFNSRTKFPLNNRQQSKLKKINRQSSKSYHPIVAVISFSLDLATWWRTN